MTRRHLLPALAPWPVLVRIAAREPEAWTIWGELPPAVDRYAARVGIGRIPGPLPRPFHRSPLPDSVRLAPWRRIVVPALGHPLPTRYPALKHLASLGAPLAVAAGTTIRDLSAAQIPAIDPFSWAFDVLDREPAGTAGAPGGRVLAVRGDLLGDVLLAVPALEALSRTGALHVTVREEWIPWVEALMSEPLPSWVPLRLDPWTPPSQPSVETAIDLSPPDSGSPFTRALVRAAPAVARIIVTQRDPDHGLAAMIGARLGLELRWPAVRTTASRVGLLLPAGSSDERRLPPGEWATVATRIREAVGVDRWLIAGAPEDDARAMATRLPDARALPFPLRPDEFVACLATVRVAAGVSSALAHFSILHGVPTIVLEHPTTVPGLYRVPVAHAVYLRPQRPWWTDAPDDGDVERAVMSTDNTYGFAPRELDASLSASLDRWPPA